MSTTAPTTADPFQVLPGPGGVEVHLCRAPRFRSVVLHWIVEGPLEGNRAAWSILPDLLTRGTASQPGLAAMAARCEELYGADLLAAVTAHGPTQVLRLGFETVADRYAGGRPLFDEAVALLAECLHDPPLEDGRLRADHLEQERTNLARAIAGLGDDKGLLAYRRMVETLHGGTPFARHSWGTLEEVAALDEPQVRAAWQAQTSTAPSRLLVLGDVTPDQAVAAAERLAGGAGHAPCATPSGPPPLRERPVQRPRDRETLAQSKLVLGFRVPAELLGGGAPELFATVLGGGSHSRLFKQVREAEGLAYGVDAALSRDSGTLVVQAGIDGERAERVEQVVLEQLASLADEGPSEEECALSRRLLRRRLLALGDSPRGLLSYRLRALMGGRPLDPERSLAELERATPDQLGALARAARLDTVYLLEGTG